MADLKTSLLSLGTMTFGGQNDYNQSAEMLDMSIDNGINFIDTAELYPSPANKPDNAHHTELFIGKWLVENKIKRQDLVIVSKVMGPMGGQDDDNPPRVCIDPLSPNTIKTATDNILKRLNSDYIDILLVHWPLRSTNCFGKLGYVHSEEGFNVENQIRETIKTMDDLIKAGKIRHYGVSNETAWGLMKYIQIADNENLPRPVTCQNPYSLLNRSYELGCSEIAIRENIGLMAYAVLGGGVLTGKHLGGFEKGSRYDIHREYYGRYIKPQGVEATKAFVELAKQHNTDPTQMAIAFVNTREFLLTTITGSTKPEHLQAYIDSVNFELSDELLAGIEEVHNKYTYACP